jgi:hypothetical protein
LLETKAWSNHNPSPSLTHNTKFLGESCWFFSQNASRIQPFLCTFWATESVISHWSPCSHTGFLAVVLIPASRLVHMTCRITALLWSTPPFCVFDSKEKPSVL